MKSAILVMRRGHVSNSNGIHLPDGQTLITLKGRKLNKYLSVLESDRELNTEMETKIEEEYIRMMGN